MRFVVMMALPMTVYFILFAREVIGLISGPEYAPAAMPMRVIMPTVLLIGLSNILGMQVLVPTDREKKVLTAVVTGAAVDFVLNLLLIPYLGASGAAIGTLAAELAVVLLEVAFLKGFLKEIHQKHWVWPYILAVVPASAAAIVVYILALGNVGYFLVLVVTAAVFFGVYGVILLLQRETITMEFVLPYLQKFLPMRGRDRN